MDLKALLAANKSKIKNTQSVSVRKPVDIAEGDRPYSAPETLPLPPMQQIKETEIPITNWHQTENKSGTKQEQVVNKSVNENRNWQQSGNETGNKVATEVATNRQQTGNKPATKWQQTDNKVATKVTFSELVGLQREIIIFICHECKNSRSRVTEPLTLEHIATPLKRSTGAVKTTIQRLEKKNCLMRVGFKSGRGGWSRYELPDDIYHAVLRIETDNKVATNRQQSGNKVATNRQQTDNKVATQPATEPATN